MRIVQLFQSLLILVLGSCYPAPKVAGQFSPQEFEEMAEEMARGKTPDISLSDFIKAKDQYVLLDAREKVEYNTSHIPGSQYVGYDDFSTDRIAEVDKDAPIVVYCSVGYRSERIGEKLMKAGFTRVYNLKGSIFKWVNEGNPLEDEFGNETSKIHGFNKSWSKWLQRGEIIY